MEPIDSKLDKELLDPPQVPSQQYGKEMKLDNQIEDAWPIKESPQVFQSSE